MTNTSHQTKILLSIVELGGYPDFTRLYQKLGYKNVRVTPVRKAASYLKKHRVDIVVAEFNFQSDCRDRSSHLETLFAILQKHENTKVIVFYDKEHIDKFEQRIKQCFPVMASFAYPIVEPELEHSICNVNSNP